MNERDVCGEIDGLWSERKTKTGVSKRKYGDEKDFVTIVCTSRCSFQVSEDEDFIDIQWRKLLYPTCWVDIEFWLDDEKVKYLKSKGFQYFATLKPLL